MAGSTFYNSPSGAAFGNPSISNQGATAGATQVTGAGAGRSTGMGGATAEQAATLYPTPTTPVKKTKTPSKLPAVDTAVDSSTVVPSTTKIPVASTPITNPMHKYASWTYRTSLWWLDTGDYNDLIDTLDAGPGLTKDLPYSYVVAEDGGAYANNRKYTNRRLPSTGGLNYNIEDIEFDTVIGPNTSSKNTNLISGTMTIIEPYGVTFMDSLIFASTTKDGSFRNYTAQPYMLQIDFVGYDDNGKPVPDSETGTYRKRFPIRFLGVSVKVTSSGAQYKIDFCPAGHITHQNEYAKCPKNITITGKTVNDLLTDFASKLNKHWQQEAVAGDVLYADTIAFDVDPSIAVTNVVYDKQVSLAQANPKGVTLDVSKSSFSIPAGSVISEVVNKIVLQSSFIIGQLKKKPQNNTTTDPQTLKNQEVQDLSKIFNTIKTTVQVRYAGVSGSGNSYDSVFDAKRNTYAHAFTYKVHQYYVADPSHPALPSLTDGKQFIVKQYDYLYTGKNIDILDLNLQFDTTWYTAVTTYGNEVPATIATVDTKVNEGLTDTATIMLGPPWLAASGLIPQLGKVPVPNPLRFKPIVIDQGNVTGLNIITDPNKATSADALKSIYSKPSGDMLTVDLKIVGDPLLCKQDDWLYVPSPTPGSSDNFSSWDTISQNDFAAKYGHLRMDSGVLVVKLNINSIIDLDTDFTNQGLGFPRPGTTKILFSGLYKILTIKNTFSAGTFTQTLSLVRLMNSDFSTNFQTSVQNSTNATRTGAGAAATAQNNATSTNATTGSTQNAVAKGDLSLNQSQLNQTSGLRLTNLKTK